MQITQTGSYPIGLASAVPGERSGAAARPASAGGSGENDARLARAREAKQLLAEQKQIQQLAQRDREVRAHEQAHAAVGGKYAGAPVYEYTRGPNGRNYATGGEVSIDIAPIEGDPEATLEKALVVRRAALAPAQPSPQDRAVAARASQMAAEARVEIATSQVEETASPNNGEGAEPAVGNSVQARVVQRSEAAVGTLIDTIA